MTLTDILRLRMANQFLIKPAQSAEQLVAWMGAVQGQDYWGGLWGIGLRTSAATDKEVEKAIAQRKIVRTWPQRGTLHFVHARDARWMLKLMAERILKRHGMYHDRAGLTPSVLKKSKTIFQKALKGRKLLTRPELYEVLKKGGVPAQNPLGYHLLMYLSSMAFLVVGPRREKQATFALFDEWIPKSRAMSYEHALKEITLRYFTSHGPATVKDMAWWSGLSMTEIRKGIEMNGSKLTSMKVDGRTYWMHPKPSQLKLPKLQAHLLPPYDEILIGYKDRSATLPPEYAKKTMFQNLNGFFYSTILLNGKVIGVWRRARVKGKLKVVTKLFRKVNTDEKEAINTAVKRFLDFWVQDKR